MGKEAGSPQGYSEQSKNRKQGDPIDGELRSRVRRKSLTDLIQDFLRRERTLHKEDPNPHKDPLRDELL